MPFKYDNFAILKEVLRSSGSEQRRLRRLFRDTQQAASRGLGSPAPAAAPGSVPTASADSSPALTPQLPPAHFGEWYLATARKALRLQHVAYSLARGRSMAEIEAAPKTAIDVENLHVVLASYFGDVAAGVILGREGLKAKTPAVSATKATGVAAGQAREAPGGGKPSVGPGRGKPNASAAGGR